MAGRAVDGIGPRQGTPILFVSALGTTHAIWDLYVARWKGRRPLLRLNLPGHGGAATPSGPITIGHISQAALRLMEEEAIERCHVVGLSMGGMVAQSLAATSPERVASLTAISVGIPSGTRRFWHDRAELVRAQGLDELAQTMPSRWFSDAFLAANPQTVDLVLAAFRVCDPAGYAACCEAVGAFDGQEIASGIRVPTLVVGGGADPVSGPEATEALAAHIPGSRYVVIPGASHLLTLERPNEIASVVSELMTSVDER